MVLAAALGTVAGLVAGLVIGFLLHFHRRVEASSRARTAEARLAEARSVAERLEQELAVSRGEVRSLEVERATLAQSLSDERRLGAERAASWDSARQHLTDEFARLSREALAANNEQFLSLADARLESAREAARGELSQRQRAIDELVRPLKEQLGRYEGVVAQLERSRHDAYRDLVDKVVRLDDSQRDLQRETRNLASALRSPVARGRWGELQLRKVVELAGMIEHCDFDVQVTAGGEGERQRPDMVVHLPGTKHVVVDAKVPLEAFQRAMCCEDDEERRTLMAQHARQLRSHVESLAKREYWRRFDPSPQFVVAFVPGDPLLAAALEHDAGLIEFAVGRHVLPATPTTLISLLWAVAYGWQQDALADNAREVQELGSELYQRLATLGDHFSKLGRSLGSSVKAYNEAVGSLENRVLVTARRFPGLGAAGRADRPPVELEPLELAARPLQAPELVPEVPAGASGGVDPTATDVDRLPGAVLPVRFGRPGNREDGEGPGDQAAGEASVR